MLEGIQNFSQTMLSLFLDSQLGEAELIIGLLVGLFLIADFFRGREHGNGDHHRPAH